MKRNTYAGVNRLLKHHEKGQYCGHCNKRLPLEDEAEYNEALVDMNDICICRGQLLAISFSPYLKLNLDEIALCQKGWEY